MQFFHAKAEVNHPITLDALLKNTILANTKISPLYVGSFNDIIEQTQAAEDQDLFGIILHNEFHDGQIDGEEYMITIASKHTLELIRKNANEPQLTAMKALESMSKLNDADQPIANFLLGFEVNQTGKVLAIENRYINESFRNKGLMKQLSYNFIQALFNIKGDFAVVSQPVHIATLMFFATFDFELQQLEKSKLKADGHIIEGVNYGVIPFKPAILLLRQHAEKCAPENAERLAVTTSELTQKFEKILANSILEAKETEAKTLPKSF